jgi:hypothetical protein
MFSPKLLLFGLSFVVLGLHWLGSPSTRTPAAASGGGAHLTTLPAPPARAAAMPEFAPGASEPTPALPTTLQASGAAALSVTVTWHDGAPAAGVLVRVIDAGRISLAGLEACTDALGACHFDGLRAGKVKVQVDRKPRADTATLHAGQEAQIALQIPRGFDVNGIVRDAGGAPVAGAAIHMGRSFPPYFLIATSAADGSFAVRSLQARVGLFARKDGHAPSLARSFRHPDGAVVQETFELRGPATTVSGQVLDGAGEPVADALLLVDGQGMLREEDPLLPPGATAGIAFAVDSVRGAHSGPLSVRTDGEGRFAIGGLRPGSVPIGVLAAGHAPWHGRVEAAAGAGPSTEIRLGRGWSLSGQVRDAQGNPAAASLVVHGARVPGLLCPAFEVGPDGRFELSDLAPGAVSVWIEGTAGAARTTLQGAPGDALTWDAELGPSEGEGPEIEPWDG